MIKCTMPHAIIKYKIVISVFFPFSFLVLLKVCSNSDSSLLK